MTQVNRSIQRDVPTTGQTVTVGNADGDITVIIEPAGTLATLTIASPSAPRDGQRMNIVSTQILTAITLSVGTFAGGITTLAANGSASYVYVASQTKWYRVS